MAQHAHDDGFHEIQLNGKQLVFVFMAATVVSVVIFLCGVLVGRGVRGERPDTTQVTTESADQQLQGAINPEKPPTVQQNDDPTKAPPPAPAEGGTSGEAVATDRSPIVTAGAAPLAATGTAATPDKPAPSAVATTTASVANAARAADAKAAEKAVPVTPVAPAVPAADDPQRGWVVQVAATKTRSEADTIAKRLSSRGYAAFVLSNNANVFRVRVGGYKDRKDADTVAARLKKEERVTPWVTR